MQVRFEMQNVEADCSAQREDYLYKTKIKKKYFGLLQRTLGVEVTTTVVYQLRRFEC
jgi:hypothetical protein